jgi:hypothetical protein
MTATNQHFILAYGSLISSDSRAKTGETGQVWPVKLHGFERHWAVVDPDMDMSTVAIQKSENAACNGILVAVAEDQIALFDEREIGYQRSQVLPEQLTAYLDEPLPEGTYWVYHTEEIKHPEEACPIVLSYVDVILSGCLEHGDAFALDFLALTKGWQSPLINDRPAPRYPRAQPELPTERLNRLLAPVCTLSNKELAITYDA